MMHQIIKYLVQHFSEVEKLKPSFSVRQKLQKLDRAQRSELRNELFARAKILEKSHPPHQVICWLQNSFNFIDKYSFRFNQVYFSPGNDIKKSIAKLLREARHTVDLCVFTITDYDLAQQIADCQRRNVKVRIITDDEKIGDDGSEIKRLKDLGIPIKCDHSHYHMHNKFGIIDKRVAITGSFNWTYTATKHNQENLLATSNFDIVKQYQAEFDRLWDEMFEL